MVMDIRDYLPPSLKHVMEYTSQAEREKRKEAAREAFGHPTPVPRASEPSLKPGDADDLLKVQPASPWSAGAKGEVDKEALSSARVPPAVGGAVPVKAVRVIPLWPVVLTALAGLVFAGSVIAWATRGPRPQGASATPTATATAAVPAAMPSATDQVMGVAPLASTSASAAPSATSTAAPSATSSAAASAKTTPAAPRRKSTTDPSDPYEDAAPTAKSTKPQPHIAKHLEFE
jgi:hypothetical protein